MAKVPQHLKQKAWDALNAKYASLDYPEWVSMSRLPDHFWDDEQNHKRYMTWLGRKLGFERPEDWYQVKLNDFLTNRGSGFLEYYNNSPCAVLKYHFPKFDWKPWLFGQAPNRFWHDLNNCRAFAKWFEQQRGFGSLEDWYGVTQDEFLRLNGAGVLDHFAGSVSRFLSTVYPNYEWLPWLFSNVPDGYWENPTNRVAYMKWLETKLGYTQPDDWYQVTKLDFINCAGASLMHFGFKTVELVRELYPNRDWHPWMFHQVYLGYWKQKVNRIGYLKWLGKQLGFKSAEDWLNVRGPDFRRLFGGTLLDEHYGGSIQVAVKELFPESKFSPWEFHQVPNGFWDDAANCKKYLSWLGKRLGFKQKDDWYQVRREDFRNNNGGGFLRRFRKPYFGLKIAYPNYQWLPWRFETVPFGFWDDETNRNWYLQWLGKELNFKSPDDWLSITSKQLGAHHGGGLIAKMTVREIGKAGAQLLTKAANSSE